ncbi:MAG: type II toxin-antitoxin system VapC family toxin [Nanoarchaeota archaeon]
MIYLDANIFLYALTSEDRKAENSKAIITQVAEGDVEGCTSVLTWDEVLYVLIKEKGKKEAIIEIKKLLKIPKLIFIDANSDIINNALNIVENYSLNPRDAIHAATAIINKCDKIASDDSDFDKIKELKRIKIN